MAVKQKKYIHEGKEIHLAGKPGENGIVPFQHMFGDGTSKTVGLRYNKTYRVGETDECGNVIEDWVYESFMQSDLNNNRVKGRAEQQMDEHEAANGVITAKSGELLN